MIDKILSFAYSNTKFVLTSIASLFACGAGIVVSKTNFEDKNDAFLFRTVNSSTESNSASADGKEFHELNLINFSYKDLLSGTKFFNNGNYVIYYGSEACSHCMQFLFSDGDLSKGNLDVKTTKISDGAFMKTYKFAQEHEKLKDKNIKFLLFEDVPPSSDNRTDDDLWTLPWTTWSDTSLEKGQIKGEFKRHDKSAVNFRNIMDYSIKIFGKDKVSGTPTVIVYKDGYPKIFKKDDLEGFTTNTNASWKDENELKKYILYYYNKETYNLEPKAAS